MNKIEKERYLYVDDCRVPVPDTTHIARNYDGAIKWLRLVEFDVIDLDYDLVDSHGTGLDILKYMKANGITARKHMKVHSDHELGRQEMRQYIADNFGNLDDKR